MTEPWHGTHGGYTNHGCRGECCKAAHRAKQKTWRGQVAGNGQVHGANSTYTNYDCRCDPCKAAHAKAIAATPSRQKPDVV